MFGIKTSSVRPTFNVSTNCSKRIPRLRNQQALFTSILLLTHADYINVSCHNDILPPVLFPFLHPVTLDLSINPSLVDLSANLTTSYTRLPAVRLKPLESCRHGSDCAVLR